MDLAHVLARDNRNFGCARIWPKVFFDQATNFLLSCSRLAVFNMLGVEPLPQLCLERLPNCPVRHQMLRHGANRLKRKTVKYLRLHPVLPSARLDSFTDRFRERTDGISVRINVTICDRDVLVP